ncbi:hypothetical protein F5Y00DRAFT_235897 [Daldinia vernicosa]|uniref:uncharacterized protein n=1 Tax=Daldinia vernicosa TaxID=114800 RepID=UPI0020089B17|nr:uncharacterized protein F5Y00DRAFT_235897 [Daldinia vernicosa]KAI0849200.1 hypothetical protein F5Y00DRAFT_235897 [Daldinia vernicosa]
MLKSTYKPSSNPPPLPLLPGWTEHKAPTGHTFYHNAATGESTYDRQKASFLPTTTATSISQPSPPPPQGPHANFLQYSTVPQLSDPATANAFLAQYDPAHQRHAQQQQHGGRGGHRGHHEGKDRPRPQPADKPKSKVAIPGCEPWLLVYTKYGRRFAYNPVKNASYWRIPDKVMKGVLELDIRGIKEKATGTQVGGADVGTSISPSAEPQTRTPTTKDAAGETEDQVELGSDYEEVEVTDDEGEEEEIREAMEDEGQDNERPPKRQRTEEPIEDLPVEFNEDDIAYQLQAMGDEYGLDPGEYDDGNPDAWPEGAEGLPLSETDARELFKDLLNDYGINPYSSWEKLIEEGRIIEDGRYTVLNTMKARKDAWEEWSRERIQILKEQRAKEEKKDPRIPYLAFLQQKATPKLYWPEFRRKYKKEAPMRDTNLNDRDREKWYREHINRLKLPQDTLKKDLAALLRSIPLRSLNNKTHLENLPPQILADLRYISLDPQTRDPLIEAYIQTLGPPPAGDEADDDGEAARKAKEERRKREKALEERERIVAEEKQRQKKQLEYGKAALREEERELERAMHVGKKGLQSQLLAANKADKADNAAG